MCLDVTTPVATITNVDVDWSQPVQLPLVDWERPFICMYMSCIQLKMVTGQSQP